MKKLWALLVLLVAGSAEAQNATGCSGALKSQALLSARAVSVAHASCANAFPTGAVSFWKMDEASAANLIDSIGPNTLTQVNTVDTAAGIIGTARVFAGSQSANRSHDASQDFTTKMSYSVWLYQTTRQTGCLLSQLDFTLGSAWIFRTDNTNPGDVGMYFGGFTNSGILQAGDVLPLNTWVHLVFVFDGTQAGNSGRLKAYRNGVQVTLNYGGTIPASITAVNQKLAFGVLMDNGAPANQFYVGRADLMGLFGTALTASDAAALYNGGAGLQP